MTGQSFTVILHSRGYFKKVIIKQGKLMVGLRMLQIPERFFFSACKLPGDKVFFNRRRITHFSITSNEVLCPFQYNTYLFQGREVQSAKTPCLEDPPGRFISDAGNLQKILIGGSGDFYGKQLQMPKGPVTFGVQKNIEIILKLGREGLRRSSA